MGICHQWGDRASSKFAQHGSEAQPTETTWCDGNIENIVGTQDQTTTLCSKQDVNSQVQGLTEPVRLVWQWVTDWEN